MHRRLPLSALVLLAVLIPGRCWAAHGPIRLADYDGTIRVACVGDSITFGHGIPQRHTNSYPAVLDRLLGERFHVRNFGVNGATLLKQGDRPYWKTAAFRKVTAFQPHAVIIKLGTNDSKPHNWKHKAAFAADLRALVDHFRSLESRPRLWLCLPVPVVRDRWGINEAVVAGKIIPIIERVAKEKGVPTIDLHAALSGEPALFPDGVHPNADGAARMARTIAAAIAGKKVPGQDSGGGVGSAAGAGSGSGTGAAPGRR